MVRWSTTTIFPGRRLTGASLFKYAWTSSIYQHLPPTKLLVEICCSQSKSQGTKGLCFGALFQMSGQEQLTFLVSKHGIFFKIRMTVGGVCVLFRSIIKLLLMVQKSQTTTWNLKKKLQKMVDKLATSTDDSRISEPSTVCIQEIEKQQLEFHSRQWF